MSRKNWTDEKLLSRLINNKTDRTRWENIFVLRTRPSQKLFEKCVDLSKSKSPKIRKIGIDILAQLGTPPRPFLKDTLKLYFILLETETEPDVLNSLLYSIGHNNDNLDNEQILKLCSFLHIRNSMIKEGLVYALLGIDHVNAIETLIVLSSDESSHIRNWATFGLGTLNEKNNIYIREALWNRVNDKNQDTKLEAIVGLARRKDKRINDIIKRELISGEYGTLIFEAIIEIQDLEFLPILKKILSNNSIDKTSNNLWIKELMNCIQELSKLTF